MTLPAMIPDPHPERARRYRQAGLVYGCLGTVVMLLSVATPEMAGPERRVDMMLLLWIGLPIFLIFAVAIAYGDRMVASVLRLFGASAERARRIGRVCQTVLTLLLTLTAIGRIVVFTGNGVGQRPRLGLRPLSFHFEPTTAEPRLLLCAVLMAVIFTWLARASWLPLLREKSFVA